MINFRCESGVPFSVRPNEREMSESLKSPSVQFPRMIIFLWSPCPNKVTTSFAMTLLSTSVAVFSFCTTDGSLNFPFLFLPAWVLFGRKRAGRFCLDYFGKKEFYRGQGVNLFPPYKIKKERLRALFLMIITRFLFWPEFVWDTLLVWICWHPFFDHMSTWTANKKVSSKK